MGNRRLEWSFGLTLEKDMLKIYVIVLISSIPIYGYSQKIKSIDTSESTIFYDSLGRPVKLLSKRDERVVSTYNYKNKYDQQNRLISLDIFLDTIKLARTINKYDENKLVRIDNYQRTKFGTVHKYILLFYNKMDSVNKKVVFSNKGDTLEIISFEYNGNNKLSHEVVRDFEYKNIIHKYFNYTLNSKSKTEYHINMISSDTTDLKEAKMYFNKNGDVVKNEEWGLNASILMVGDKEIPISKEEMRYGKKGFVNTSKMKYEYDRHNNWITLFHFYKGDDKMTTYRTITYY